MKMHVLARRRPRIKLAVLTLSVALGLFAQDLTTAAVAQEPPGQVAEGPGRGRQDDPGAGAISGRTLGLPPLRSSDVPDRASGLPSANGDFTIRPHEMVVPRPGGGRRPQAIHPTALSRSHQ